MNREYRVFTLYGLPVSIVSGFFAGTVLTFLALRLVLKGLPERIARGEQAAASFVATSSIAVGLLNAASMTFY